MRENAKHPLTWWQVAAHMDRQSLELLLMFYIIPIFLVFNHTTDDITHFAAGWWMKTGLKGDFCLLRAPTVLEKDLF